MRTQRSLSELMLYVSQRPMHLCERMAMQVSLLKLVVMVAHLSDVRRMETWRLSTNSHLVTARNAEVSECHAHQVPGETQASTMLSLRTDAGAAEAVAQPHQLAALHGGSALLGALVTTAIVATATLALLAVVIVVAKTVVATATWDLTRKFT